MTAVPLDAFTVLTTKGPLATKRIVAVQDGPPKIENYGKAQRFSFDEWDVSSFDEMAAALKALQRRPQSFVVRGKPADGIKRSDSPRRLRPRGDEPATLILQPRYWLPLDLDSVPCPAGIDPIFEPDAVVEHVVELLPEEFHGVSVFWAFTSGHSIKPGIRIRLCSIGSTGRSKIGNSKPGSHRRLPRSLSIRRSLTRFRQSIRLRRSLSTCPTRCLTAAASGAGIATRSKSRSSRSRRRPAPAPAAATPAVRRRVRGSPRADRRWRRRHGLLRAGKERGRRFHRRRPAPRRIPVAARRSGAGDP